MTLILREKNSAYPERRRITSKVREKNHNQHKGKEGKKGQTKREMGLA